MMENLTNDLQAGLDELKATGNFRTLNHAVQEGRYILKQGQRMLNLSSNDYLGLAADRELYADFLRQVSPRDLMPSSSSSRLLTGNHPVFDELEGALARIYGTEAALVFNSGYDANAGILPTLAQKGDLIVADKLVHASLIDGMRQTKAHWYRFKHNDFDHLARIVTRQSPEYRRIIIVTESIFSMDGDAAPLREIVRLKRQFPNVLLYVDEAHAFGVRGPRGLGCAEEADLLDDIDLLVGTLGKATASAGAFVVCTRAMRDHLVNHARSFIFTTALPPLVAAWSLYVIYRLQGMQERRQRLEEIARRVHQFLAEKGIPQTSDSHIIPLPVGNSVQAVQRAEMMQRHGFYLLPVRPPTVPEGTARLRLSLRADLTDNEVERLLNELNHCNISRT